MFFCSYSAKKSERQDIFLELAAHDANTLIESNINDVEEILNRCTKENLVTIMKQLKLNWRGQNSDLLDKDQLITLSQNEKGIGKACMDQILF